MLCEGLHFPGRDMGESSSGAWMDGRINKVLESDECLKLSWEKWRGRACQQRPNLKMSLNTRVAIHTLVFSFHCGYCWGVLVCRPSWLLRKWVLMPWLNATLAQSSASSVWRTCSVCSIFFLMEMSHEFLGTDLDLTASHKNTLHF